MKLDGSLSKQVNFNEGVPQGSILSPTLLLLYVNDITNSFPPRVSNSFHADDLAAWTTAEQTHNDSPIHHAGHCQQSERRAEDWCMEQAWELSKEKTSETKEVRGHAPPEFFPHYIQIYAIWGHLTA